MRWFSFMLFCGALILRAYGIEKDAQKGIENFLLSKKYTGSGIGVVIRDIEKDTVLVSVNGEEMMNPASVAKLVTGAAAFELLGNTYTFSTDVFIDGSLNRDSGIVNGNIYLRGGGDPGFSAERLWLLVQHLYHMGIRKVSGDLVLDDYFFDSVMVGPGFDEDSSSRAYQPLISALSASFSTLAIHQRTGGSAGSPVHVDVFPRIQGVKVISTALTAEPGKGKSMEVRTAPTADGTCVIVNGSMGLDELPKYSYRKVWQTWEMFGGAVLSLFEENNIEIKGKMIHGHVPDTLAARKPFYEFTSEPLPEYVSNMFKYSSNYAAEMIFKTLSATDTSQGSWNSSASKVLSWWGRCKLPGKPQIQNGSGMGNSNRISADQITALLSHVWEQKSYLPDYLAALSISGTDGTLKSRFRNSSLKGIVRGKTGTLNSYRVSTLAGYIILPGTTYSFAVLCNKVGSGQYDNWVVQEKVLEKFCSIMSK